jgi:hypothetical protein
MASVDSRLIDTSQMAREGSAIFIRSQQVRDQHLSGPPRRGSRILDHCPLEEFSRRASYSTGRLATTPEMDTDLTEEWGVNGLCLERQAGLPEGHKRSNRLVTAGRA